jgi:hypothetical protein
MKNSIILLLAILLVSCNSARKIKRNLKKDDIYVSDRRVIKKEFFPMFKRAVFVTSVQYSFNSSPEIMKLLLEDKGGDAASELLDLEDVYSVAKMLTARIKKDSVNSIGHASDLEGKTVFKTCLEFYTSRELDSIARKLYKTKYSKPYILYPLSGTGDIRK